MPFLKNGRMLVVAGLGLQAAQVAFFFLLAYFARSNGFLVSIYLAVGVIGIGWLVLAFVLSYWPLRAGHAERARTPTLVFGILSIFTFSVLSGLMYVLAYHELKPRVLPGAPPRPLGSPVPLAGGLTTCSICGRSNPPASKFCRGCGMAIH